MNDKLKKIIIPFVLMLIFNLGSYYFSLGRNFGGGYSPHLGVLLISGLLLGPYGAIGSVFGNFLCDLIRGYSIYTAVGSSIVSFAISYLAYKLWYGLNFKNRIETIKPRLKDTSHIILFLAIILVCGFLFAILTKRVILLTEPQNIGPLARTGMGYFINFINSSFIYGIIGIWLSNKFDFFHTPQKSEKQFNKKLYRVLGILLIISAVTSFIMNSSLISKSVLVIELITVAAILILYLTKPFTEDIVEIPDNSIPESIMNRFFITLLILAILGVIISTDIRLISILDDFIPISTEDFRISMMITMDLILLVFLIPSISVLRYIEKKVIQPITSFSHIEKYIHENQKVKSEGLLDIYSPYLEEDNEIGTLARSYSDLIKYNNNYIENINKIEGEKRRIEAELDIAHKIQAANLPTESIETDEYIVDGYSKPAKEVGGDFFDYYMLDDDNLAIVIGDVSDKGVPAALLAMITQVMIQQLTKHELDPSKVLHSLNNQLCEHNDEMMFITLWLGIYNKNTKKITFSNAGHNPPLFKDNGKFKYLSIDTGIVLGIMEDFEYIKEEIEISDELILYTDGITDANNENNEMYGEGRLLNFFNGLESDAEPIAPLLKDISNFSNDANQYDDMTILYLKNRN